MNIFTMLGGVDYIVVNNQLAVPDFICGSDDCPDDDDVALSCNCLLYTSPSPRD